MSILPDDGPGGRPSVFRARRRRRSAPLTQLAVRQLATVADELLELVGQFRY